MRSKIYVLYPFDLGLELDFKGKDAAEFLKSVSSKKISAPILLNTKNLKSFQDSEVHAVVYKFGTGLIQITLSVDAQLQELARGSLDIEKIQIGRASLLNYCGSLAQNIISRAAKYAVYRYDMRLAESELFVVFNPEEEITEDAKKYVEENKRVIFGLLSGEAEYDRVASELLEREEFSNLAYYENEIILIKRFGAFVSSSDSPTVNEMIKLALCQFWSLKSYNYIMDKELDNAQKLLSEMPTYYKFWQMPQAYQRFSKEAIDFDKDKISIIDSIYNVIINIPKVESDWHLKTVHKSVNKVFDIEGLYKTVELKIERIEGSYNAARDYLSTNFSILLNIIFLLSLLWMVIDTLLLYTIARK